MKKSLLVVVVMFIAPLVMGQIQILQNPISVTLTNNPDNFINTSQTGLQANLFGFYLQPPQPDGDLPSPPVYSFYEGGFSPKIPSTYTDPITGFSVSETCLPNNQLLEIASFGAFSITAPFALSNVPNGVAFFVYSCPVGTICTTTNAGDSCLPVETNNFPISLTSSSFSFPSFMKIGKVGNDLTDDIVLAYNSQTRIIRGSTGVTVLSNNSCTSGVCQRKAGLQDITSFPNIPNTQEIVYTTDDGVSSQVGSLGLTPWATSATGTPIHTTPGFPVNYASYSPSSNLDTSVPVLFQLGSSNGIILKTSEFLSLVSNNFMVTTQLFVVDNTGNSQYTSPISFTRTVPFNQNAIGLKENMPPVVAYDSITQSIRVAVASQGILLPGQGLLMNGELRFIDLPTGNTLWTANLNGAFISGPILTDVDSGTPEKEIVVLAANPLISGATLYVFDQNGNNIQGSPLLIMFPALFKNFALASANVNAVAGNEIFIGGNNVAAGMINGQLSILWTTSNIIPSSAETIIGEVNNDGQLDLIFSSKGCVPNISGFCNLIYSAVYAQDAATGNPILDMFPIVSPLSQYIFTADIALADVTLGGNRELIVLENPLIINPQSPIPTVVHAFALPGQGSFGGQDPWPQYGQNSGNENIL